MNHRIYEPRWLVNIIFTSSITTSHKGKEPTFYIDVL